MKKKKDWEEKEQDIEDLILTWLDCDAHGKNIVSSKINFSDFEDIASVLSPEIVILLQEDHKRLAEGIEGLKRLKAEYYCKKCGNDIEVPQISDIAITIILELLKGGKE